MSDRESPSKPSKKYFYYNLLAMAIVITLLVVATFWGLNIYTHHGEEIAVPNVCGLSYEQAVEKLESVGLQAKVRDTGYVRSKPSGIILEQSFLPGHKVKSGRMVELTINSGNSPTIVMPDLADNSSLREAESRLRAIGFKLDSTQYIDGEKDWVYEIRANGHNVVSGQRISIDARITLVVGNGITEDDYLDQDSTEELYWEPDDEIMPHRKIEDAI